MNSRTGVGGFYANHETHRKVRLIDDFCWLYVHKDHTPSVIDMVDNRLPSPYRLSRGGKFVGYEFATERDAELFAQGWKFGRATSF